MDDERKTTWQPEDSLLFAQVSCLCLGVGMLIWGLAPAIVQRLVTGHAPDWDVFFVDSVVLLLGVAFVGLQALVARAVRWAVWTAFAISAMLAAAGLALTTIVGMRLTSSFLVLLSGWNAFACWLAIGALARKATEQILRREVRPTRSYW